MSKPWSSLYTWPMLEAKSHFGISARPLKFPAKPTGVVTSADREVESVIRQLIRERFPRDGVIGEEYGGLPTGDYRLAIITGSSTPSMAPEVLSWQILSSVFLSVCFFKMNPSSA
jgi:hypothetical protein